MALHQIIYIVFILTFGIAFSSSLRACLGDNGPPPKALFGEPSPVDTDRSFNSESIDDLCYQF